MVGLKQRQSSAKEVRSGNAVSSESRREKCGLKQRENVAKNLRLVEKEVQVLITHFLWLSLLLSLLFAD
jgi:hypothetical protein